MRLIALTDSEVNSYSRRRASELGLGTLWNGGSDAVTEGDWRWPSKQRFWSGAVTGSAPEGAYANWQTGEPNNDGAGQHCGQTYVTGTWDDAACSALQPYACMRTPVARELCGNGSVDADEACDASGASAECDADCSAVRCGDGSVNAAAGEECDDGNAEPLDACDACKRSGLVAHWRLAERVGAVAWDASGAEQHAALVNATFTEGAQGLALNGLNQLAELPPARLLVAGRITLAAFVDPVALPPGLHNVVEHIGASGETWLRFNGTRLSIGSWDVTSTVEATADLGPLLEPGTYIHVAGTYDGDHWNLYVDGRLLANRASALGALALDGKWLIGGRSVEAGRLFHGRIADVRVYDRPLSQTEVSALAAQRP
jgi:cysteine-rich repeat protein